MHWEDRLRDLAATQEGLVGRIHLSAARCTPQQWWRAKQNGRWEALSPRVLCLKGAPETDKRRALAAVFDASPGAVLHGPTVLAWFGMRGFHLRTIELARPRGMSGTRPELGELHRVRDLRPHHVIVHRGVPTECPLRAIWFEAAKYAAPSRVELGVLRIGRLLDAAHRLGLVTWAALHDMVGDIRQRGRSGTIIMKQLADARAPGSSPTDSRTEDRFEEILPEAQKRPLQRQLVLGGHEPIGRVDFRDPDLPLAVEVNTLTFHTAPSDRSADMVRYRRLTEAGFTVAVVWEDDLWSDPAEVIRTIVRARRSATDDERVVIHSPSCPWPADEAAA